MNMLSLHNQTPEHHEVKPKAPYTLSVKLSDFTCDVIPDGKTE
jgi:hypothetical protein